MEVAVLGGLVSVAYATSRFFDKKKGAPVAKKGPSGYLAPMRVEGFAANGANSANEGPIRPGVGSIPNGFPTGTNSASYNKISAAINIGYENNPALTSSKRSALSLKECANVSR